MRWFDVLVWSTRWGSIRGCASGHGGGGRARDTFGGVGGLVLAPVAEDLIFDPGHVVIVGFVVLVFGPLSHDGGVMGVGCLFGVELLLEK